MRPNLRSVVLVAALATPFQVVAAAPQDPPPAAAAASSPSGVHRWAAGGDLGLVNPLGDGDFDLGPMLAGYAEYWFRDRLAWRGMISLLPIDGPEADPAGRGGGDVDVLALTGNLLYAWPYPAAAPFVTGGVGIYDYDPDLGDSDLEIGLNVGGGVDVRVKDRLFVKVEGDLHATTGPEPDGFFVVSAGLKWRW